LGVGLGSFRGRFRVGFFVDTCVHKHLKSRPGHLLPPPAPPAKKKHASGPRNTISPGKGSAAINRYTMAQHVEVKIGDGRFGDPRRAEPIEPEKPLDGIDVIRTREPPERLSAADAVRGYKALAHAAGAGVAAVGR